MNPQDDPEARIRALEQPLSDMARASELGTEQRYDAYGYPPPVPPPPTQQWPYADQYPAGFSPAPRPSGLRPWMLIVPIAVLFLAVGGGIVTWMMVRDSARTDSPWISGGGGLITSEPPSRRSTVAEAPTAAPPAAPSEAVPQPGSTVTVSGIGAIRTIACNESVVVISGANNRITVTGHCVSLTVSGFENNVTVESAEAITASGFNNHVAFHTGAPTVSHSGEGNIIEQG